jgi:hypothetical protein
MSLTAQQCMKFDNFLFRRTPDWDVKLAKDRFPYSYIYSDMYAQDKWPANSGTTQTFDHVHVTRPNDDGCWDKMNADACLTNACDPKRFYTGWGSTRNSYDIFHRDYQSPVFCYDQLRFVEEAMAQLNAIIEGHKKMPDLIISDFLRLQTQKSAQKLWICNGTDPDKTVTITAATFADCTKIDLGSAANLPTSKITMNYLDNHIEDLGYNGYQDMQYTPEALYRMTADQQTVRDLANQNPALAAMYHGADFAKGGKFFEYGVMNRVGNWLFKRDPEPARYEHIGNGVLHRIWPYQNIAATVGKKPVFDSAYKKAPYQAFHVYNRAARNIYVGDTRPVNSEMKFLSRSMMGKWSWKSPDFFQAADPNSGDVCNYQNDKKNKGYFLGEYEFGVKTIYPEIEMWILAQREPQGVVADPICASANLTNYSYQQLSPYNYFCGFGAPDTGSFGGIATEES